MIRVLVADDARTFRALLRALLEQAPDVEVVGEAADGNEAVAQVLALRPDVVTMDVRMPGLDGIAAIEAIMARAPTPVVVVSAEGGAEHQDVAFRALAAGAVEVLPKPSLAGRFEREAEEIRRAVRAMAGLTLVTRWGRATAARAGQRAPTPAGTPAAPPARSHPDLRQAAPLRVVGVAASTGGPPALTRLLAALPGAYPAALLVVQHIARGFEAGLAHWLARETSLAVKVAAQGEPIRPATVYLAPADRHLTARAGAIHLDDGPEEGGFRPSATVLLRSLAREYGAAAAGVVLTGMGEDGAAGLLALRGRGGVTLAQGPQSAVVYGMPRAAVLQGAAAAVLELEALGPELVRLAMGPPVG